jgi:hypothetical protein
MPVLVDTSIWTDHFKKTDKCLANLLVSDQVVVHSMIIAEITCGTPPDRKNTLFFLKSLSGCKEALLSETLNFIEANKLYGAGCGVVDFSLLTSALITPDTRLWTRDKNLRNLAEKFNIEFKK